jgi:hypothetical protein
MNLRVLAFVIGRAEAILLARQVLAILDCPGKSARPGLHFCCDATRSKVAIRITSGDN